jgi:hypothetical protein
MTNRLFKHILFIIVVLFSFNIFALSRLEDIDKSPIGTYKGQFLFGAHLGFGVPFGQGISSETDFADGTTYTFEEQDITKTIELSHVSTSFSLYTEYVYLNNFGARISYNFNRTVQRTNFGKDYNNLNNTILQEHTLLIAPTYHLTSRESFNLIFVPSIGASFYSYTPTPSLNVLLDDFVQTNTFTGTAFTWSLEILAYYFFENGTFIDGGFSINHVTASFDSFFRTKDSAEFDFANGASESSIYTFQVKVGAGYALYH